MNRELGHMLFGNPQSHDVPDFVSDELYDILEIYRKNLGLSENAADSSYGYGFPDDRDLVIRSYDWEWDGEDEDMLPNVEFKDIRVWWYKYLGRGMTTDREISTQQWLEWLREMTVYAYTI